MMERLPIRFCGTGAYVPEHVLTNRHFENYLDTSNEWIVTRTGIRERRRVAPDECTSTMSINAAQRALEDAGMTADEIDVIICATATPDCPTPATASFIQVGLGAKDIPAFDVGAACAGFIHAMIVAVGLMNVGLYKRPLVIGAETLTRFADPQDRNMIVLFGDAAGAAILAPAENSGQGILYCDMGCDGTRTRDICAPAGGSRLPTSETTVAERLQFLRMRGREVYKFAVLKMQKLISNAMTQAGLTPDDLKLVIPHQSNLRIIESVSERVGLPMEKFAVNIDRYGNTSAASVILSLDEARRDGTLQTGDHVILVAIGAGLCWGTMVLRL
ncbi:MAG: beta-ketoacyl-ACP synthase III [Phycisphaerae bacterium]